MTPPLRPISGPTLYPPLAVTLLGVQIAHRAARDPEEARVVVAAGVDREIGNRVAQALEDAREAIRRVQRRVGAVGAERRPAGDAGEIDKSASA